MPGNESEAVNHIRICRDSWSFVRPGRFSRNVVEGPADKLRTYSRLTQDELQQLYFNETGHVVIPHDYNTLLQTCRTLGLRFLDQLPTKSVDS